MSAPIPTSEPLTARAGDTWRWVKSLPDYPAPAWRLRYSLFNAAGVFSVDATDNGDGQHLINIAPANTAAYVAGRYDWIATVTDTVTSDRFEIAAGDITITPDLSTAASFDGRSHARRVLDALNAVIEGRATTGDLDIVSNSFGGLAIARNPDLLLKIRNQYAAIVSQEQSTFQSVRMMFV